MAAPTSNHEDGPYVFVSYAHRDAHAVLADITFLQSRGQPVWYDEGIYAGASWRDEIAHAIEACNLFVFFISRASLESTHCQREINYALDVDRPVVCVYLEDVQLTSGLEMSLMDRQALRRPDGDLAEYHEKLIEGLRRPTRAARTRHARSKPAVGALVGLLVVLALGVGWMLSDTGAPVGRTPAQATLEPFESGAIAVMPFASVSTAPDTDLLARGFHSDILSNLARIPGLVVIAQTSIARVVQSGADVAEIAARLRVRHVMEGTIQRSGDQLRINLVLIDARTGASIWSQTFNRSTNNLFEVQSEVANQVADGLQIALDVNVRDRLERPPTTNMTAWGHYTRARQRGRWGQEELREAIAADPDFALAYAELAHARLRTNVNDAENLQLIDRALELEPDRPEFLFKKGLILFMSGQIDAGRPLFERARQLNPTITEPAYAEALTLRGYPQEAMGEFQRLRRVDPLNPHLLELIALEGAGHIDELRARANDIAKLHPGAAAGTASAAIAHNDYVGALRVLSKHLPTQRYALAAVLHEVGLSDAAVGWLTCDGREFSCASARERASYLNYDATDLALMRETGRQDELFQLFPWPRASDASGHDMVHMSAAMTRALDLRRAGRLDEAAGIEREVMSRSLAFIRVQQAGGGRAIPPFAGLLALPTLILSGLQDGADGQFIRDAIRDVLGSGGFLQSATAQYIQLPMNSHLALAVCAALEQDIDTAVVEFELARRFGLRNLQRLDHFGLIRNQDGLFGALIEDARYREVLRTIEASNARTQRIVERELPAVLTPAG